MKKLYLSEKDKKILGVCGGVAAYFDTDPTLIRVLSVILVLITGLIPGIFVYIILGLLIPKQPSK